MNKKVSVKEYDIITCNNKYQSQKYKVLDEKDEKNNREKFNELTNFIRSFSSQKNYSDILDFMKISYKRGIEDTVEIRNYVGLIQLDSGFQIEILPKILYSTEENTKKILVDMINSLKNFNNKIFSNSQLNYRNMNIYEIFIRLYVQDVNNLIKTGLKSSYNTIEENLQLVKGKILFEKQVRKNFAHKEKMFCSYDEYDLNRPENRIIKATLMKLLKVSTNVDTLRLMNQALGYFDNIEVSNNYDSDFAKVNITRDMKNYEALIEWSKIFLHNNSFTNFAGDISSKSLLFRMDKLFESYVAKKIRQKSSSNWKVWTQDKRFYLFDSPKNEFRIIPDVVMQKNENTVILDTKWKELDSSKPNYGISQQDMYQIYAYSKKYNTSNIWLLYPKTEKVDEDNIWFKSNDNVNVNIFFVDLNDKNNINNLIERIENNTENTIKKQFGIIYKY